MIKKTISDHLPKGKVPNAKINVTRCSYKDLESDIVKALLTDSDWTLFASIYFDYCWNTIYARIMEMIDN